MPSSPPTRAKALEPKPLVVDCCLPLLENSSILSIASVTFSLNSFIPFSVNLSVSLEWSVMSPFLMSLKAVFRASKSVFGIVVATVSSTITVVTS